MSPLVKPCAVAVTTIGVALVDDEICLTATAAVSRSSNAALMADVRLKVPSETPSLPFSNKRSAIGHHPFLGKHDGKIPRLNEHHRPRIKRVHPRRSTSTRQDQEYRCGSRGRVTGRVADRSRADPGSTPG